MPFLLSYNSPNKGIILFRLQFCQFCYLPHSAPVQNPLNHYLTSYLSCNYWPLLSFTIYFPVCFPFLLPKCSFISLKFSIQLLSSNLSWFHVCHSSPPAEPFLTPIQLTYCRHTSHTLCHPGTPNKSCSIYNFQSHDLSDDLILSTILFKHYV